MPSLFSEFSPVSTSQWEETIFRDLRGANPDSLHWPTYEGITVKPFYNHDDLTGLATPQSLPAEFPYVRTRQATRNQWLNTQDIHVTTDSREAIDQAADVLQRGIDSVHFLLSDPESFRLGYLIRQIDLTKTPVSYTLPVPAGAFINTLFSQLKENRVSANALSGFVQYEARGLLAPVLDPATVKELAATLELTKHASELRCVAVNGAFFRNQGSSAVQELAFTMSVAVSYLDKLTDLGLPPETVARNLQVLLTTGTDYFFEMAKFRALRLLWAAILKAYGAQEQASHLRVHATTSRWHQTTFDPHTNLLRTTTGAMAAILGGCDSLSVEPFDSTFQTPDAFSKRLARNIPLILREESYFDKIVDPAAGSYYLESLTGQLTQRAWTLFQQVEAKGGFIEASASGFIEKEIAKVSQEKHRNIASGKDVIVGTNRYPNLHEKTTYDQEALLQSKTFDTARGAYPFEVMRMAAELHHHKRKQHPVAAIAVLGGSIERHVHASFAKEFFSCANFDTKVLPFDTVPAAATVLLAMPAKVIVLSASAQEFAQFGRQFGPLLKAHQDCPALILAADPKTMKEEMIANGFEEFIFEGCDTKEIIARIHDKLTKED